jgi:predicted enzyme related to lactoylglutathione lyase
MADVPVLNQCKARKISPMLAVNDMLVTVAFYEEVLGFSALRKSPQYCILQRDGQTIHFKKKWIASQDVARNVGLHTEIYIEVSGIHALWEHVKNFKDRYRIKDLFDREYGMTEFHIFDPDDCLIFVGEPTANCKPVPFAND